MRSRLEFFFRNRLLDASKEARTLSVEHFDRYLVAVVHERSRKLTGIDLFDHALLSQAR